MSNQVQTLSIAELKANLKTQLEKQKKEVGSGMLEKSFVTIYSGNFTYQGGPEKEVNDIEFLIRYTLIIHCSSSGIEDIEYELDDIYGYVLYANEDGSEEEGVEISYANGWTTTIDERITRSKSFGFDDAFICLDSKKITLYSNQ